VADVDFSKYPDVHFRPGEELNRSLSARGENKNTIAKRDLARYYDLLAVSLPTFTMSEALLLCDALNGVMCRPDTLWGNIAAACQEQGIAEKWEVDAAALLARLREFSAVESQAVIDAVERAWNTAAYSVDLKGRVLLAGLVK